MDQFYNASVMAKDLVYTVSHAPLQKEAATHVKSLVFEHSVEGHQVRIICANALHTQSITKQRVALKL
jgi:hypothetical protein